MLGHEAPVLSIAITPDGERFATGGARGQIVFWSLAEGRPLRTLRGHKGRSGRLPSRRAAISYSLPVAMGGLFDGTLRPEARSGSGIRRMIRLMCLPVIYWRSGGRNSSEPVRSAPKPDGGHRAGPTLYGVFGRRAGTVAEYPYSTLGKAK